MKVYCALEFCRHHAISSDEVGFVDFPAGGSELRRWLALTGVRHVVRGVTRLCTDHFPPDELLDDDDWERRFPGQVQPNPRVRPGALPTVGVPGWLDDCELESEPEPDEPPSMFVRQEGSAARRVQPTARLREARGELFDGLPPPPPPAPRRARGRPPRGRRGRPPTRRRPSPPPDLSDPAVRARLVQQALDEYDWRQAHALRTGRERAADGTETLYVSVSSSDEEREPAGRARRGARGGTAVRSRRGRGSARRRGAHGAAEPEEEPEPEPAERLPPNTSQRFREVLVAQRELQTLAKQLEATPVPAEDEVSEDGVSEDGSLMVLRGGGPLAAEPGLPPEGDHYSEPTSLEVALGVLHRQRLENLRLRAELLRAAIRDRQRGARLAEERRRAADATTGLHDRLGDMFTPAQMKLIQNRSLRRTPMWDTVDIKRAIGLRRLCTRRAYAYVKDVLRVPLPGLAVLRGSSQRNPETALMYTQMVDDHRLRHMTKRLRLPRPARVSADPLDIGSEAAPISETEGEVAGAVGQEYIVLAEESDGTLVAGPADGGGPLLVDRAAGRSPPPADQHDHFLMLVPEEGAAESPPHRPGILRGAAPARFRLLVRGDGQLVTEDGRPLPQLASPDGLRWMDAAQVSFADDTAQ